MSSGLPWYKATAPYRLAREVRRSIREGWRRYRAVDRRRVTLEPDGPVRGNVLLSYIVRGFFEKPGSRLMRSHTHYWESMEIARIWQRLGFRVDVVDNYNYEFTPDRTYDYVIGARMILERLGERANADAMKILHIDTAHWVFHRMAQYERLYALQQRRGVSLRARRLTEPNRAIEYADCATMLGNDFTAGTYAFAGKPIHRIPISTVRERPWNDRKDYGRCRNRFLWFGSHALAHKGLDLTLEAFARLPEYHLTVCGPIDREDDFRDAYHRELFDLPNVDTVGWVDVQGQAFQEIIDRCVGFVYPSCSEGQSGSVVTCLHAGLIPIVSYESGVDVRSSFGTVLEDCSIDAIRAAVIQIANHPGGALQEMSQRAWEFARSNHTRQRFSEEYERVARALIDSGPEDVDEPSEAPARAIVPGAMSGAAGASGADEVLDG